MNKYQKERDNNRKFFEEKAKDSFINPTKGTDSGAYGKALELSLTNSNSRKTKISKAGKVDTYFSIIINGEKKKRGLEIKSNGGRIDTILKSLKQGKDGYIAYKLFTCNKNTNNIKRETPVKLFHYSTFIELLEECNAIKTINKNGEFNGYGIQNTSKEFYLKLLDYPINYKPENIYNEKDLIRV